MLKQFTITAFLVLLTGTLFAQIPFEVKSKDIISPPDQYLIAAKWSPNGSYIAAAGENYGSLWLYNIEDDKWQKLVEENGAGWDFDWSPDSKRIAFRSNIIQKRRKQTTIKYVDIITGEVSKIVDYSRNFSTPKWITTDVLAFMHNDEYKTVAITQKNFMQPQSSQFQENICLFTSEGIHTRKSNQAIRLLEPLKGSIFNASFSPDGTTILFEKADGKIYSFRENSNDVKVLAEGEMPAWSSDGKHIVYANPKDDGYKHISSDIFICDAAGINKRQITKTEDELEMRPHWSPDGNKIVCDSNGKIFVLVLELEK